MLAGGTAACTPPPHPLGLASHPPTPHPHPPPRLPQTPGSANPGSSSSTIPWASLTLGAFAGAQSGATLKPSLLEEAPCYGGGSSSDKILTLTKDGMKISKSWQSGPAYAIQCNAQFFVDGAC